MSAAAAVLRRLDTLTENRDAVARCIADEFTLGADDAWSRSYWPAKYVEAETDLRDTLALLRDLGTIDRAAVAA